ncbi:MAG: TonB-dependent receptor domain-containing protein [Cellvibrionaceae bacterium]
MKNSVLLSAAIAAIVAGSANANDAKKVDDELIVTATRVAQPIHKVLASVEVIGRSDIEKTHATNMVELLGRVPGIDYRDSGSRGSNSSIYMRGTNSDHVLILIDGVRSASATSGTTALQQIPLDQIERIEIVKGPRASLYGADAIGGVIQVFTRRGGSQSGYVATEVGSNDLFKGSAGFTFGNETTKASIGVSYEDTDGFDSTNTAGADADDDGYEEKSIRLSFDHRFANDWIFNAAALRTDADTEFDSGSNDYSESLTQTLSAGLIAPISEDLTIKLTVAENRDESEGFGTNTSVFDTKREMATVQADYSINEKNVLTLGYDYYEDAVTSTTAFTVDAQDNKAYFLQYQGELQQLLLTASFRSDDHENFGRNNTRTLAVGYPIADNTLLSISYGTAFKAPTFNDLHFPYQEFDFGGGFIYKYSGNPNVTPESSKSYEILLRSNWENISWYASYYETQVEDLIELGAVGDVNTVVNVSEAEITGAEVGADYSLLGWNNTLSVTYTDPRDESDDSMLSDRSRGAISYAVDRRFGDLEIYALWKAQSYRYNSSGTRLSGFNTVDVRASYEITEALQLSAKVNNIFDVDYTINQRDSFSGPTIYQTAGRTVSLSAKYSF